MQCRAHSVKLMSHLEVKLSSVVGHGDVSGDLGSGI